MARRQHLTLMLAAIVLIFFTFSYLLSSSDAPDLVEQPPSKAFPEKVKESAVSVTPFATPVAKATPTPKKPPTPAGDEDKHTHTQPIETPDTTAEPKAAKPAKGDKEKEVEEGKHGHETGGEDDGKPDLGMTQDILTGGAIAPKLENATAKAELGRASWTLFHTMMARFPEKPLAEESKALETYIRLFARLYPCGDCAQHFQQLLEKFPPQTSGRMAAAGWACFVHNQVNDRLGKPEFDCNKIGDFYDCGCGDEEEGEGKGAGAKKPAAKEPAGEGAGGTDKPPKPKAAVVDKGDTETLDADAAAAAKPKGAGEGKSNKPATKLELEKEGLTKGG